MNYKTLSLQDIRIGDWLADKITHFPMQVVAIHADGTVHLNFGGNEADPFEYDIANLERSVPLQNFKLKTNDRFYFVRFDGGVRFVVRDTMFLPGMIWQVELLMNGNFFLQQEQAQSLADELSNTLNKHKSNFFKLQ